MSKLTFYDVRFIKTAMKKEHYPKINEIGKEAPEIALLGRSNVGKSTLINHLFGRKKLARVSSTPGKTQALNFFLADESILFVDLPGYGFANVPVNVRRQWGPMIQGYLESREQLKLLLFLFDLRRDPTDEDRQLLEWIAYQEIPVIFVFTKTDKIPVTRRKQRVQKILKGFDLERANYVSYSSVKNIGRQELISAIHTALRESE